MTRRFFSGNTLDQAVMAAARHYGIEPDQLAYRQIEKRHGFLRTRKAAVISVDPEMPRRGPEVAAAAGEPPPAETEAPLVAEPVAPAEPLGAEPEPLAEPVGLPDETPHGAGQAEEREAEERGEDRAAAEWVGAAEAPDDGLDEGSGDGPDEELLEAAEQATRKLLHFAGIEADAVARSGRDRIEVEVEGPDDAVLVVESGKGLLAIQHLLPRLLRGSVGRSSFVRVDSKGFHQQRKERLEELAHKEAEAASHSGGSRTLPPMAPDERRIVHMALKDSPAVVTESRGTGLHKRVVIRPVSAVDEHRDVEARHGL